MADKQLVNQIARINSSKILSKKTLQKLKTNLNKTEIKIAPEEFASLAINSSILIAIIAFLISTYANQDPITAIAYSAIAFAITLSGAMQIPNLKTREKAEEIETKMAIELKKIAIELKLATPFEQILENTSKQQNAIGREFETINRQITFGTSVQEALFESAKRVDSQLYHRIISELIFSYENASSKKIDAENLEKLSEEIIAKQKNKLREFQAKTSILGLFFTTTSCILPALYCAFAIIGSQFLELEVAPIDLAITLVIIIPAANAIILLLLKSQIPKTS